MRTGLALISGLLVAGVVGTTAISDADHDARALGFAAKARQAQMTLYAFNIGILGNMAKGDVEYDAAAATAAAANLAALSKLDQSKIWPMGSDNVALGKDKTRALPAIWTADSKAGAIGMEMATAAAALEQAAGGGLDALRGAIGPVGKTCGSCHEGYREGGNN